jgi:hypothetical protein
VGPLVCLSAFRENIVDNAGERRGCVNAHRILRNIFFRCIQSRNKFPFLWFSAEVSWVQCHSFIHPPVHGVQVDLQDKHAVK